MKHKFQDPHLKQLVKRLVELDCPKVRKFRTIKDVASDFGVSFCDQSLANLNDDAAKESVKLGKPVKQIDGVIAYHPRVLAAVFSPLMARPGV